MQFNYRKVTLGANRGFTKVSISDFGDVSKHRWSLSQGRYATTTIAGKKVSLHRFILGLTDPSIQADHINGNGLDNRRENLREATNRQNQANRRPSSGKSYKGVVAFPKNRSNPWAASFAGRHLGYFASEDAAAWAYNQEAILQNQEFALLNVVERPQCLKNPPIRTHTRKRAGATSRYRGVSFRSDQRAPWSVFLNVNNRPKYCGSFSSEKEAARHYNQEALKFFGAQAALNKI